MAKQKRPKGEESRGTKRRGRDLELLVARLETVLNGTGVVVKSPERIAVKSGTREVDVTVRFHAGSVPVLIAFECRDRSRTQDVEWIEQLAGKKTTIGATAMVAVSSSGFSEQAVAVAKERGVEVRAIDAIELEDFDNLGMRLDFVRTAIDIVSCKFWAPTELRMLPEYQAAGHDDKIFSLPGSQERYSLRDVVEFTAHNTKLLSGLRTVAPDLDGGPRSSHPPSIRNFTVDTTMAMHLAGKEWHITGIAVSLRIETTIFPMAPTKALAYATPGTREPHITHTTFAAKELANASAIVNFVPSRGEILIEFGIQSQDPINVHPNDP
jgi:hypothetical protein